MKPKDNTEPQPTTAKDSMKPHNTAEKRGHQVTSEAEDTNGRRPKQTPGNTGHREKREKKRKRRRRPQRAEMEKLSKKMTEPLTECARGRAAPCGRQEAEAPENYPDENEGKMDMQRGGTFSRDKRRIEDEDEDEDGGGQFQGDKIHEDEIGYKKCNNKIRHNADKTNRQRN